MSVASANRSSAFIPTPHKFRLLLVVLAKTASFCLPPSY